MLLIHVEEHVGRLDVSVEHAALMQVAHAAAHLCCQAKQQPVRVECSRCSYYSTTLLGERERERVREREGEREREREKLRERESEMR